MTPFPATLSKQERLSGKTTIEALVKKGSWLSTALFRVCVTSGGETGLNRILVSVPKRNFKRAVKRNLLKRRIREAYRTQKGLLATPGHDLMFFYNATEVASSEAIRAEVADILSRL